MDANLADPKLTHVADQWKYSSPLIACRFDPKSRFVFSSAQDNSVQRWNLENNEPVVLKAHDSWVRAIAFSPDGEFVMTAGGDGRIIWWPTAADAPEPIRTIDAHQGWIRSLAVSPDGQFLASSGNDNLVKLWRIDDRSPVRVFSGHEKDVYSTLFVDDGKTLISGDLAGKVHQWEITTAKVTRTFDAKQLHTYNGGQGVDFGGVRTLSISPDKKHLACGGLHKATNPLGAVHEPLALVFEWESQKLVQSHIAEGVKGTAWRVMFHDQPFLCGAAGGSSGGFLLFWKTDQPKEFHRFKLPNLLRDMDLAPDGHRVATAHYDRHLRISRLAAKVDKPAST
ncbi:MAG: WD40 repeat domain-containing protein [Pirellulaceae bacterium]|jgi:WD40 repeat protein|nr:WD40 repeat domain-containing protein [Pirellulaceae bacterium]